MRNLPMLGLALLLACTDTGGGGAATSDSGPPRGVDGEAPVVVDASAGDVPTGGAEDGEVPTLDMTPPGPDGAMAECAEDPDCDAGHVCIDGRCVEGVRCGEDRSCPGDAVCVGQLCLGGPDSASALSAEPNLLVFTFSGVGDQVVRRTLLVNEGEAVLEVQRFDFEGAATFGFEEEPELPIRLVPGQHVELAVRYQAEDRRADQGRILAISDGTEPAEIRLVSEIKIVGADDPCLRVIPNRLNFGAVQRGNSSTLSFDLLSCGTAPVEVRDVARGVDFFGPLADTFQLVNPPAFPLMLPPGAMQEIEVSYEPRRAGFVAGFWNVLSNDPASPEQRVDVTAAATPPPLEDVEFHIRLEWNTDLTDVDLHLIGPGGNIWTCAGDCYFSNPNPNWADPMAFVDDPFLDVDDVDGFGPENINLETPAPGTYTVLVHYWDDHGGDPPDSTIEILSFGQVVGRYGPQRTNAVDDVWEVVEIDWPGLALRELGGVQNQARGQLCGGF